MYSETDLLSDPNVSMPHSANPNSSTTLGTKREGRVTNGPDRQTTPRARLLRLY